METTAEVGSWGQLAWKSNIPGKSQRFKQNRPKYILAVDFKDFRIMK